MIDPLKMDFWTIFVFVPGKKLTDWFHHKEKLAFNRLQQFALSTRTIQRQERKREKFVSNLSDDDVYVQCDN